MPYANQDLTGFATLAFTRFSGHVSFAVMSAKREFLESELAWVRIVRKTTKPERLHLVEPAVAREREILAEIEKIEAEQPDTAHAEAA